MIVIGNEILSGRTQDANIQHLATEIGRKGVQLREVRVVPDIEETIATTVRELSASNDYVFTTGGIGPTHDDITSDSVARAFGVNNVIHPQAYKLLADYYQSKDIEFNAARQRMAHTPEGAELIDNHISLAPGYRIHNVFVMAGVPRIMRDMLAGILETIEGGAVMESRAIGTDLHEGVIAAELSKLQRSFPAVDIGSYPKDRLHESGHNVILILRSTNTEELEQAAHELHAALVRLGGSATAETTC